MKSHNELDKKLRDNTSLPMGLEWDDMSEGIYEKMSSKKEKKNRWFFLVLCSTLLLVVVAAFYLFYTDHSESKPKDINNSPVENKDIAIIEATNKEELIPTEEKEPPTFSENQSSLKSNSTLLASEKASTTEIDRTAGEKINSSKVNDTQDVLNTLNFSNQGAADSGVTSSDHFSIVKANNIDGVRVSETVKAADLASALVPMHAYTTKLLTRPNSLDILNTIKIDHKQTKVNIALIPSGMSNVIPNETFKKSWSIASVGSLVFWDQNYNQNSLLDKQSKEEKTLTSYHVGIEAEYYLHNSWSIYSGLDFSRLYSKYEGNFRTQELIAQSNVVVEIEINPLRSKPLHHTGDTTVLATTDTYILYHNIVDRWSIPLGARYHLAYGKLSLTAGLGVQLGLYKAGLGYTAREDQLVAYTSDNDIYRHGLDIAVKPELGIRYNITDHIFAGVSLNYQQHLLNWSQEQNLRSTPRILRTGFTLGYRL